MPDIKAKTMQKTLIPEGSTCFRPNTPIMKNGKKDIDPSRLALPTSPNTHVVPKYITENQKKKTQEKKRDHARKRREEPRKMRQN